MTEPPDEPPVEPPPWGQLQPPQQPTPPEPRPPSVSVGVLLLGVLAVVPMSFLLVFGLGDVPVGVRAGIFAGLVFLGGGALCFVRSPQARGFGIGLMAGWALLSITTGGICTALSEIS